MSILELAGRALCAAACFTACILLAGFVLVLMDAPFAAFLLCVVGAALAGASFSTDRKGGAQ